MKDGRLHLRLPEGLLNDIKVVARQKGVTVSYLVELALLDIVAKARRENPNVEDVPQL